MRGQKMLPIFFIVSVIIPLITLVSPSSAANTSISRPPTPRFKLTVPRINEIIYKINVNNAGNSSSWVRIDFALPKTWTPDTYIEIKENKTTQGILERRSDRENTYLYILYTVLEPNQSVQINITFYSLKYKLDYYTHKRVSSISYPNEYLIYTKPENYIESNNSLITTRAETLVGTRENPFRIAEKIYDFVISYLTYEEQPEIRGALWAYQNGRGDCTEYGTLFVALLRAVGIPARTVTGHVSKYLSQGGTVNATRLWVDSPHLWAEFYVEGFGWISVDPTFGEGDPWDHFGILWAHYLPLLKGPTMDPPNRALITLKSQHPESVDYSAELLVTPLAYLPFTDQTIHNLYKANDLTNTMRRVAYEAYEYEFNITEAYPYLQETYDSLYNATQAINKNSTIADVYATNAFQNANKTLQSICDVVIDEARTTINKARRELRLLGVLSGESYIKRAESCKSTGDYSGLVEYAYYAKTSADQAPSIFIFIGPVLLCGFTILVIARKRAKKE